MRRSGNLLLIPIALFLCALLPAGCGKKTNADAIRIGIVAPLTGTQAAFGEALKNGYLMALEEINTKGGAAGKKLELDFYDDRSQADTAVQGVAKLIDQDQVPIILGSFSSENTKAMVPAVTQRQVPLIIPTAIADNILDSKSPWVFRIASTASDFARAVVAFLKSSGTARTMAIVYENTNYGQSSMKAMLPVAKAGGIEVVIAEPYEAKSSDYKSMLHRIKQANPDVIYFVSYLLDATTLMRQTREIDLNPAYYTSAGGGFMAPEFPTDKGAGKNAEYTFSVRQWFPQEKWAGSQEFDAGYFKRYGLHPGDQAMQGYTALKVAALAIDHAGSLDRTKIHDAIKDLNLPLTSYGPVRFDANGQNQHPLLITQVQAGRYRVVFPDSAADVKPIIPAPQWSRR